jgi:hypothetical protein
MRKKSSSINETTQFSFTVKGQIIDESSVWPLTDHFTVMDYVFPRESLGVEITS